MGFMKDLYTEIGALADEILLTCGYYPNECPNLQQIVEEKIADLIERRFFKPGEPGWELRAQEHLDNEARQLVRALLGAPPPRVWKKWPNLYKKARDFVYGADVCNSTNDN